MGSTIDKERERVANSIPDRDSDNEESDYSASLLSPHRAPDEPASDFGETPPPIPHVNTHATPSREWSPEPASPEKRFETTEESPDKSEATTETLVTLFDDKKDEETEENGVAVSDEDVNEEVYEEHEEDVHEDLEGDEGSEDVAMVERTIAHEDLDGSKGEELANEEEEDSEDEDEEAPVATDCNYSDEVQGYNDPVKIITEDYLPWETKLTEQHARDALSFANKPRNKKNVEETLKQMTKRKAQINQMARLSNEHLMCVEARRQKIVYGKNNKEVKSFMDLQRSMAEDGSEENMQKMFEVVQGQYDKNPHLATIFKDSYFAKHNLSYPPDSDNKGFMEKIHDKARRELKRKLNRSSEKTHNIKLNITRDRTTIEREGTFKKRKKGEFDVTFIKTLLKTEIDSEQGTEIKSKKTTPRKRTPKKTTPVKKKHVKVKPTVKSKNSTPTRTSPRNKTPVKTTIMRRKSGQVASTITWEESRKNNEYAKMVTKLMEERAADDAALVQKGNAETIKKYSENVNRSKKKEKKSAGLKTPPEKTQEMNVVEAESPEWADIDKEEVWLRNRGLEQDNGPNHLAYVKAKQENRKWFLHKNFPTKKAAQKKAAPKNKKKSTSVRSGTGATIAPKATIPRKAVPKEKNRNTSAESGADATVKPSATITTKATIAPVRPKLPPVYLTGMCKECYEVEPNYEWTLKVIEEDEVDGDMTAQVEILNHRKLSEGEPEVLAKFDNGAQLWTLVDCAVVDAMEDLEKYFKFNKLNDTAMVTSLMKKARKKNEKKGKKVVKEVVKKYVCKHKEWEVEMGYKAEYVAKYCHENYDMANFICSVCTAKFVPTGKTVDTKTFKPSFNNPGYVCINRLLGCKHAACYKCFHVKNLEHNTGNSGRTRRTRSKAN